MVQADIGGSAISGQVLALLKQERVRALSLREWKFRLAGYGYAIKEIAGAQVVTTLPHGVELGILPPNAI